MAELPKWPLPWPYDDASPENPSNGDEGEGNSDKAGDRAAETPADPNDPRSSYALLKTLQIPLPSFEPENAEDLNLTKDYDPNDILPSKLPPVFDPSILALNGTPNGAAPSATGPSRMILRGSDGSGGVRPSTGPGGAMPSMPAGNSAKILVTPKQLEALWNYAQQNQQVKDLDGAIARNGSCSMHGKCLAGVESGLDAAHINFYVDVNGKRHDRPMAIHEALAAAAASHASGMAWAKDATTLFKNNGALELAHGAGTFPDALKNLPDGTIWTFDGTINGTGGDGKVCGHIIEKAGSDKDGSPVLICDGKALNWKLAGYSSSEAMLTRGEWHAWWVPGLVGSDRNANLVAKLEAGGQPAAAPSSNPARQKTEGEPPKMKTPGLKVPA